MFSLLACGPIAQRYFSSGPICATALVWGRLGPRVEALAQAVAEPAVSGLDVNALSDRADLNAVLDQINIDRLRDRVDIDRLLASPGVSSVDGLILASNSLASLVQVNG